MHNDAHFGTRAVHAGQQPDPTTGAVMTPIYMTSTYAQPSPGVFKGEYDYSRSANPTRTALEANLAALENGRNGLTFSSGCAALCCLLHTLASGDHVLVGDDVYGGTFRVYDKVFKQLGIGFTQVDMTDPALAAAAFKDRTRLIWVETPTNPLLKVVDIRAMADLAHARGALLAVDNTFATPYLQNPLDHGADVVSHSSTKYLGGHSDIVGGALITRDEALHHRLKFFQNAVGATPSAFDCFLLLRSTKTLHVRMARHCESAGELARYLQRHDRVRTVTWPGLESHPQHAVAARQMRDFGGMVTITLDADLAGTKRFLEALRVFTIAESLGGVESLVDHPAIMTHASVPPEQRAALGIADSLVRLSVGIEDVRDLRDDLEHALAAI